jgi:signal transduction histidine kinase
MRFRTRLFVILSLFALLPAILLTALWGVVVQSTLPLVSSTEAWTRAANTGDKAIEAARAAGLSRSGRAAVDSHEAELRSSYEKAKQLGSLASGAWKLVLIGSIIALILITIGASRVAGHLSRQLSRPLDEVVHWTELIGQGRPIPDVPPRRGAPEFETLRRHMRKMQIDLTRAREQAMEAERLRAFRESARQVAHELKNPLMPIRFAVDRLRREATPAMSDSIDVLDMESRRLERMARSFAQFGRLPEGPSAPIDPAELVRYAAVSAVPETIQLDLRIEEGLPVLHGHHDAIAGALSNILLNAVDACQGTGKITISASRYSVGGSPAVQIAVRDTGCGMPPELLARIWEPYVTQKPGGTGLGLAIARQAVEAHSGRVDAISTPGEGTEITMTLPAVQA